jgi:hypothetical protein
VNIDLVNSDYDQLKNVTIVIYIYSIHFHNYRYFLNIMLNVKDFLDYNVMDDDDDDVLNVYVYYYLLLLEYYNVDDEMDNKIPIVYYHE